MRRSATIAILACCFAAGCASDAPRVTGAGGPVNRGVADTSRPAKPEASIPVSTTGTTRPHVVLEDMTATARQWTVFGRVPTEADVEADLRKRAAELRADAVVNVRFGKQGAGAISWSQISGTGQAIRFTDGRP